MKKSVLLALILIAFNGQAQFKNFTLRVAATYPVISSVEESQALNLALIPPSTGYYSAAWAPTGSIKQSFEGKVGYDLSGRFNYPVSDRFFLSSGISATYTRFQPSLCLRLLLESQ